MKKRFSALAALAVGVSCLMAPTSAHAAEADQCWVNLDTGESACVTTFDAVLASGGHLGSTGAGAKASVSASVSVAAAASNILIGTIYEDTYYSGASVSYYQSSGCDAYFSVEAQLAYLPAAWNDTISSFHSYNGCRTKLYSDTYYGGTGYGFFADKATLGSMNDETSSIQWT